MREEGRQSIYLYKRSSCCSAFGYPSIPHTTLLLLKFQPRLHTCLHLPACFTSSTPSVTIALPREPGKTGRSRTSSKLPLPTLCTKKMQIGHSFHLDISKQWVNFHVQCSVVYTVQWDAMQ